MQCRKNNLENIIKGEYFIKINTGIYTQEEIDKVFEQLQKSGIELKHKYLTGTYHIKIADLEKEKSLLEELNKLKEQNYITKIEPVYKTKTFEDK